MAEDFKAIRREWDHLQALRATRDGEMQQIADVFMPRKSFICTPQPGLLRPRMVTTSKPIECLNRSAAMLVGYLVDPTRPNILPNVSRGLVAAGRNTELDSESRDYLTDTGWTVHDRMMLAQSKFFASLARVALEMVGFGTGVLWTGRKRGFGPIYAARPLRNCWIGEDEEQVVDTLFYRWTMPAWKAVQRYPEARKIDKLAKLADDEKTQQAPVTLVHAVKPRVGGEAGAFKDRKPWASVVIAPDFDGAVLEVDGFDSFPFAVPRLGVEEGSAYGTGLAWRALPTALVLNDLQGSVERGVAGRVEPAMFAPSRFLSKPLDRRRGAVNYYDESGLGFQNLKDAIQYLQQGGDVGIGVDYMKMLAADLEEVFLTDWMKLRENGNVTAEEIIERRNLRIRSMVAYVPSVDRDLMGVTADRTLEAMVAEDQLPSPPDQLSGVDVDWEYAGPLAIAQQQGQVDAIRQLLGVAQIAANMDPESVDVLALDEGLRAVAEAVAAPAGVLRSRQATDERRAARREAQQAEQEAQVAATTAAAARDGAQAVNSLSQAENNSGDQGRMAA
ncbi:portal protein [Caulobacter sp. BK020]|uniref:portal protein n=1 Tax=Caulobacter sp. BK020 TaxID=2512117 RepID=UPI00104D4237|nr:portal protein [Caulobacter sp. BK020]TCS14551.1 head-to-tail connecting protein [Caulobacter sp. BK020]